MVARSQRKARSTKTSYWLYSTGCSAQSNKNIPLLVKDLFTEHVHSRFIILPPLYWTIFINITFKIKWHESYCEYLVIRKELNVVYRLGIIISKTRYNFHNFKLLCSPYCLEKKRVAHFGESNSSNAKASSCFKWQYTGNERAIHSVPKWLLSSDRSHIKNHALLFSRFPFIHRHNTGLRRCQMNYIPYSCSRRPRRPRGGLEVQLYSLTSTLVEGGWSTPRPGRFTPGKESRYLFQRRLVGAQGLYGRVWKILPPPGFFFLNVPVFIWL